MSPGNLPIPGIFPSSNIIIPVTVSNNPLTIKIFANSEIFILLKFSLGFIIDLSGIHFLAGYPLICFMEESVS